MVVNASFITPVCPPYGRKVLESYAVHPRPPGFTGLQRVGPITHSFCVKTKCYQHVFMCHDWASSQPLLNDAMETGEYKVSMQPMSVRVVVNVGVGVGWG